MTVRLLSAGEFPMGSGAFCVEHRSAQEGAILLADKAFDNDGRSATVYVSKTGTDTVQISRLFVGPNPIAENRDDFMFCKWLYRYRNGLVERFFNKLKQFRGIA